VPTSDFFFISRISSFRRINAACRLHDMSYSRFIDGLNKAGIEVDRKILSDLAVTDLAAFGHLCEAAKAALMEGAKQMLAQLDDATLKAVVADPEVARRVAATVEAAEATVKGG
jgi:hypothetical protein